MKKTIIILLLLLSSIAFSQRKTKLIGNKLQVLDLKNAKIIGVDSKGNAVDNTNYVQEKIDELEVGGRNLAVGIGGLVLTTTNIPHRLEYPGIFKNIAAGKYYTVSFDASVVGGTESYLHSEFWGGNGDDIKIEGNVFKRYSVRIKYNTSKQQTMFFWHVSGSPSNIRRIKIYKGTNTEGWSPSPEDQVADWAETNTETLSFIKNKPTKLSQFSNDIYPVGFSKTANPYESGVDCNTITKVGETRFIRNAPNSPYPGFAGYVSCIGTGDVPNRAWQIATRHETGAVLYIRTLTNKIWYKIYTELSLTKLSQLEADNIYTKIQSDEKYMPSWDKDYNDLINKPTNLVTEQRLTDSIVKVRELTYQKAGHKIALSDADTLHINNKPLQSTDITETGSPNGGYLMRVNGDGWDNPSEIYIDKSHISIGVKDDENNVSKLDIRGGKVELKNFDVGGANNGSISVGKSGVDIAGNIMERVVVSNDTIVGVGKHLTIPEGVKVIKGGYNLSVGFKNLTSIQFPISLEEIGEKSFYGSSLKSVALKDVKKVGTQAFYGCAGLTSVNLGDKLEVIETLAFGYCEKIKEVIFPSTLTSIGAGAFDTSAIKNISLPAGCHYKATSFFKWEENGVNYPIITGGILDD